MSARRGKLRGGLGTLEGYILPKNKTEDDEADDSEEENEEEEQQPEFLDVAEIDKVSSGGHLFQSWVPLCKEKRVVTGKKVEVEGRFALRAPWWQVTCSVVEQRDRLVVKGFPSYKLRSDLDRQDWIHIVSLFLTACGVEEQNRSLFFDWLPTNRNVSLNNLIEVLDEFSKAGNEAQAQMIRTRLLNSDAWLQVQASCLYPHVMKYLPTLLPHQFTNLLGMAKRSPTLPATNTTQTGMSPQQGDDRQEEQEGVLAKLEHIIANDVWKLGFTRLVYRELKLVRCEAQLRAFEECNLLQKMLPLHRCSLMVYDHLKKHCFSTGSTCLNENELREKLTKGEKMSDDHVWEAIDFLKEQTIVVLDKRLVVLFNFNEYETGIANCLRKLVERGPWNIPVNPVEVLQAAAEERWRDNIKKSEEATSHPVEGSPSVAAPTNQPDLLSCEKESPSVKSEDQIARNPSCAFPEQQSATCSPIKLDPDHVQAAQMICANPITIISGKAGCGKTTVVSELFRAAVMRGSWEQQKTHEAWGGNENDTGGSPLSWPDEDERRPIQSDKEILLTAPTGRAASLLSKKTKFQAYTLHQVLFRLTITKKNPELWEFQDVRILVVDEGSMVPVHLLYSVLKLLTHHSALRKFIILGDVRQLPSIQPGNVLHDLFSSLIRVGWAIEMKTNHRAESQLIVENAGIIADSGMKSSTYGFKLKYDAIVDLDDFHDTLTADKKFILIRMPLKGSDDDLQKAARFLIGTAPGLNDHTTSQFITFKRDDVALINELCCKHYNNHTTKNHKNKLKFQPGDKVCCTRNGYVGVEGEDDSNDLDETDAPNQTQSGEKKKEKPGLRLCNGEIFFIRADTTKVDGKQRSRFMTLDDGDGRVFTVNYKEIQRKCRLQHAWARTIHTYQGSENETIVYVVGDSWAQRWKHIYTAITRGQKRVYVKKEVPRQTRLSALVKDQIVQPEMLVGTPQAQPNTPKGDTHKL
uniref:Uncharacterized protein n=1 Tax=Anabas testudineus TaxID=64144 RepID=A0A3Q1H634_ANATE